MEANIQPAQASGKGRQIFGIGRFIGNTTRPGAILSDHAAKGERSATDTVTGTPVQVRERRRSLVGCPKLANVQLDAEEEIRYGAIGVTN